MKIKGNYFWSVLILTLLLQYQTEITQLNMKTPTPKQAAAQILKMDARISKIEDMKRPEYGSDWYKNIAYNKTRDAEIRAIYEKINQYRVYLTKEVYEEVLEVQMCCDYEDFIG